MSFSNFFGRILQRQQDEPETVTDTVPVDAILHDELKRSVAEATRDRTQRVLKGYIWMCGMMESGAMTSQLTILAASAYTRLSSGEYRSGRIGKTCLATLANMRPPAALCALRELRTIVNEPALCKQIDLAIEKAAQRGGARLEEMVDTVAPAFGFDKDGRCIGRVGKYTARLLASDDEIKNQRLMQQIMARP